MPETTPQDSILAQLNSIVHGAGNLLTDASKKFAANDLDYPKYINMHANVQILKQRIERIEKMLEKIEPSVLRGRTS